MENEEKRDGTLTEGLDEEIKNQEVPETKEETPKAEPAKEEEPKEKTELEKAIELLSSTEEKELDALDEEHQKLLSDFLTKRENEEVISRLNWLKNATNKLYQVLEKNLDENEEFRVTSKTTLQKNVQILEDQVKLNQFNKILKPLAQLYSNYAFMLTSPIDGEKTRSNIEGILEEIEVLLSDYNVEKIEANVNDPFNPVDYKVAKRIVTNDPSLDKKVAAVIKPGFKKDRIVLVPLRADMYVYKEEKKGE